MSTLGQKQTFSGDVRFTPKSGHWNWPRHRRLATTPAASPRWPRPSGPHRAWAMMITLATREERQGQNRLPGLIRYEHHQGRIVVAALFSQLQNCVLGIRKCRRNIWQVRTIGIILDLIPSVYREEISRHRTPPPANCHAPRNSSGSLAMFTAIRRASSLVSSLAAGRAPPRSTHRRALRITGTRPPQLGPRPQARRSSAGMSATILDPAKFTQSPHKGAGASSSRFSVARRQAYGPPRLMRSGRASCRPSSSWALTGKAHC